MCCEIILVIELDGTDDTKAIGQDPGFISVAEMTVKILLFDLRDADACVGMEP